MANWGGDGRAEGRKDGRTDGRLEITPCVLQDIGPLGPLPKKGFNQALNLPYMKKKWGNRHYRPELEQNCPLWNQRSLAPPGPLPHYLNIAIITLLGRPV